MKYFEAGLLIWLAIKLWIAGGSSGNPDENPANSKEEADPPAQDDAEM